MNCPNQNALRAFHDGESDGIAKTEIEQHLASCAPCRARVQEIGAVASSVQQRLTMLEEAASATALDSQVALSRFKAQHEADAAQVPVAARVFGRRWRPAWAIGFAAILVAAGLAFPSGRSLAQRLLATLRVEKVQPIRLDFSSLEGNRALQQMIGQMLSEKMVVTADEKAQHPLSAESAARLAGFPVRLLGARTDAPQFTVEGKHGFTMKIDRERLQEIFDQASRPDLLLPARLEGATVSVQVPRAVSVAYGNCPRAKEPGDAGPREAITPSNCVALIQAPSPEVNVPSDLNIQQLAEIALQLGGMDATKARELCQAIDWKSTLVLPIPRFADSYTVVNVDGSQGTLISHSGRRGTDYALVWVKNGIIYALAGHGDTGEALKLAASIE